MDELISLSAKQLVALIKNRKISCIELMSAYLSRITEVNPKLNAIVEQFSPEQALKQASIADSVVANNDRIGKLHGIPMTIKARRNVEGFLSSYGNLSFYNKIAREDVTY